MTDTTPNLTYYLCLDLSPTQESHIAEAFAELESLLKQPPVQVDCPIRRVPPDTEARIVGCVAEQNMGKHPEKDDWIVLDEIGSRICGLFKQDVGTIPTDDPCRHLCPRLLICCQSAHELAGLCLRAYPNAFYGVVLNSMGVVYELDNHYAVWHEFFHLIGAEDCYGMEDGQITHRGPTCEQHNCIMQYAATEETVGDWPFLCRANVERIRRLFARCGRLKQ